MGDENIMKGFSYVNLKYPFSTSGFFWNNHKLNDIVDKDPSPKRMCRIFSIQGLDCLSKVKKYYDKANEIF